MRAYYAAKGAAAAKAAAEAKAAAALPAEDILVGAPEVIEPTGPQAGPPKPVLKSAHGFTFFVLGPDLRLFFTAVLAATNVSPLKGGANGAFLLKVPGPEGAIVTPVPCCEEKALKAGNGALGDAIVGLSQDKVAGAPSETAIRWYQRAVDAGFGVISVTDSVLSASGVKAAGKYCQSGVFSGDCVSSALLATKSAEIAARLTNPEGIATESQDAAAVTKNHALVVSEPSGGWLAPGDVDELGRAKGTAESGVNVPLLIGGAVLGVGLIAVAVGMSKRKK
jgi:hypothetical protein